MKRGVLIVTVAYKPSLGGVAEMTYPVALGFSRAGRDVVVLAPEGDDGGFDVKQPFETVRVLPVESGGLVSKPAQPRARCGSLALEQ